MATLNTGRPITRKGPQALKKRISARKWYQKLSDSEKTAYVQRRSKEAQREGDARRYAKNPAKRDKYHRTMTGAVAAAIAKGTIKKQKKCAVCGSTKNVEFHHTGKAPLVGRFLCAKHNNRAKPLKS